MAPILLPEVKKLLRVFQKDFPTHFLFYLQGFEVLDPTLGLKHRIVGAEQDFVLKKGVGVLDQHWPEVFRRPTGKIDVDVGLVHRHGELFFLPGHRRVSHDDREAGKIGGHVVEMQRMSVLQLESAAARGSRADACLPRVRDQRNPQLNALLPERIEARVIGEKCLNGGMELETTKPQFIHRPLQLPQRDRPFPWIDRSEADELVGIFSDDLGYIVIADVAVSGARLGVDREDYAEDIQRLVFFIHLLRGLRQRGGFEIASHLPLFLRARVTARFRDVNMNVDCSHCALHRRTSGVGSGESGVGNNFLVPHSPFPTPHSRYFHYCFKTSAVKKLILMVARSDGGNFAWNRSSDTSPPSRAQARKTSSSTRYWSEKPCVAS